MRPVVVATPDVVGSRMAGPGIRAFCFARELAKHFSVELVAQHADDFAEGRGLSVKMSGTRDGRAAIRNASVVISQPTGEVLRSIRKQSRFIVDLFDPVLLELHELYGSNPRARQRLHQFMERLRLDMSLRRGDLFLVAAPRQIDYYEALLGATAGDFRSRCVVVPFGCDEFEAAAAKDDPAVVVWNGGVWEWLDPDTAVQAVRTVNRDGVPARLMFLGSRRPSADQTGAQLSRASLQTVESEVTFHSEWVPYEERGRWLTRCKVAIMLHRRTPEAEFSVRTRVFDAIAARLPVIATRGGFAAELVEKYDIGRVVEPSDADGVAAALRELLVDDDLYRRCVINMKPVAEMFRWDRVVQPICERIGAWQGER